MYLSCEDETYLAREYTVAIQQNPGRTIKNILGFASLPSSRHPTVCHSLRNERRIASGTVYCLRALPCVPAGQGWLCFGTMSCALIREIDTCSVKMNKSRSTRAFQAGFIWKRIGLLSCGRPLDS
ncbi:hypothetical protein HRR79_003824 [Exophiala dermatitidis]|nr:hypothetical protein HRR79_003824 [Exophiala dermatitidis]